MEKLIVVYDSMDAVGPCGGGYCTAYYKVCELIEEAKCYMPVECIETIACEDAAGDVPFTISGEIGDVEYEGVSMIEAATHYIVSCELAQKKKQKEAEEKAKAKAKKPKKTKK